MENTSPKKLIFIYNADSGLGNMLLDGAHKILSPSTYECKLCEMTFGAFTENRVWKKFRTTSDLEMEFLHKDEFKKQYASKFGYKFRYPIVLAETQNGLEVLLGTEELKKLDDAQSLIAILNELV